MRIIGHRGARGLAPENTIAGLQAGLEYGADELEFDLRVTADGVVVLHHDKHLNEPGLKPLIIAKHSYEDLKQQKPDLISFDEMLDIIKHPVSLYVEVKPKEPTEPIVAIIRDRLKHGWKAQHFLLASKSQKTLRELHQALPKIQKIVIEPWSGARAVHRAKQVDTKLLSMNQRWLWWGFIRPMSRRGGSFTLIP